MNKQKEEPINLNKRTIRSKVWLTIEVNKFLKSQNYV